MQCVIIASLLLSWFYTGMHYESAGREVQAAGSAGGSHAEGAEVSSTTEGRRNIPTAKPMLSFLHMIK